MQQKPKSIQFKNKIVQIGCGSAPGNLVFKYYLQEKSSEKTSGNIFRKKASGIIFRKNLRKNPQEKS